MNIHVQAGLIKLRPDVIDTAQSRSEERINALLAANSATAVDQLACLMALQDAAPSDPGALAHQIVMRQLERLAQFGSARLRTLSHAQVAVIVRDLTQW